MQKSFLPKETLDLKQLGKWHTIPFKHAVVKDASLLEASLIQKNQHPATTKVNTMAFSNSHLQRAREIEAIEREIEARSHIRYVPSETLITKDLLSPFQGQSRIACIEHDYFPQKQAFLQESNEQMRHTEPQSQESLSAFNMHPLLSQGLDHDIEFHAGPTLSERHRPLQSIIQHWPSKSNDSATKPKLLLELEGLLQTGLQLPQNINDNFNFNLLALYSDVFDRYIQHTGTYRGLLAGVKDMYDRAITFMMKKVERFSHSYESLQFFESRIEVVLDKIISEYRVKLRKKDDEILEREKRIHELEHSMNVLQEQSSSQALQFEALIKQKQKFEKALAESLKYNDATTHRMLDLQGRCEDIALIRNRARKSEDLCKNAIIDRDECRSALEDFRALPARIRVLEKERDSLQAKLLMAEKLGNLSLKESIITVELFEETGLPFHQSSLSSSDGKVVLISEILNLFANSKDLRFIGGSVVENTQNPGYLLNFHSKMEENRQSLEEQSLLNVLSRIDGSATAELRPEIEVVSEFECLNNDDPTTPEYLKSAEDIKFVKNLNFDKGYVERMINDFWVQRRSDGSGLPLGHFVVKFFRNKYPVSVEMQVTYRYNFIRSLDLFIYDADFEMLKRCLEGRVIEEVVIAQQDFLVSVTTNCNRFIDANCQGLNAIEKAEFFKIIRKICPTKSERDMKFLRDAMDRAQPGAYVQTANLFASNEDGDQSEFAEALRDQFLDERIRYLNLIESTLQNICISSRSEEVSAADVKVMFGKIDPNKPIVDVRHLIQKGFGTIRDVTSTQTISPVAYVNNLRSIMCATSTKWLDPA